MNAVACGSALSEGDRFLVSDQTSNQIASGALYVPYPLLHVDMLLIALSSYCWLYVFFLV